MVNIYEKCPTFETNDYLIRLIQEEDVSDLWKVYSDQAAIQFFNSDNCDGDTFYYDTLEKMEKALDFWLYAYQQKWFVRLSIIAKKSQQAIGTIELFHRDANDYFNNTGLLRLDLKSEFEKVEVIEEIVKIMIEPTFDLFYCNKIATKGFENSHERIKALKKLGFTKTKEYLYGKNNTKYDSYYELNK